MFTSICSYRTTAIEDYEKKLAKELKLKMINTTKVPIDLSISRQTLIFDLAIKSNNKDINIAVKLSNGKEYEAIIENKESNEYIDLSSELEGELTSNLIKEIKITEE